MPRMQNCLIAELEQPEDHAGTPYMDYIAESSEHGKRHRIMCSRKGCVRCCAWALAADSPLTRHGTLGSG
jgi:hypothetical protein